MLGVNESEGFKEAVRLYLMLHADHEGAIPIPAGHSRGLGTPVRNG